MALTPRPFARYLPAIDAEMRRAIGDEDALLYRMTRYHLGWEDAEGRPTDEGSGKALRPVLCLLTCEALCGSPEPALPAAAAIEILHNFSLVHDDIQDQDRTRRGRATAWTLWGVPQAINAGDALWALSTRTLLRAGGLGGEAPDRRGLGKGNQPPGRARDGAGRGRTGSPSPTTMLRAMQMLNDASLTMIEGQALDLSFETREDVTVEEYLDMIARKTGALIACSITTGALFGGVDPADLPAFARYGELVGRIFQVRDDVLGVWGEEAVTGKSATSDIRRKKQSLPVVYTLGRPTAAAHDLAAIYAKPELDDADVTHAVTLLEESGARDYADRLAEETFERATEALATLPVPSEARHELDEMGRFLLERDR